MDRADRADSADDEFRALARRVRQTAERELAEIEDETDRAERKRQDLTTRGLQAMMEGERWQLTFSGRSVEAIVVHVGQNYLGFQDRAGNLHDVTHRALAIASIVAVDPRSGRAPITFRPATFRARLLTFEEIREVELGGRWGDWSLRGTIDSVNIDHLLFRERSGQETIVATEAIGYLSRAPEHDRRGKPAPSRHPR